MAAADPHRGHLRAALAALEAPEDRIRGEAFNVGRDSENYQVRELGDIVQDVVPGSTSSTPGRRPDPRSYRVDFGKLARAFPELELTWTRAPAPSSSRRLPRRRPDARGVRERPLHTPEAPAPPPRPGRPRPDAALEASGVIFEETKLEGAYVLDLERREDERGFFARTGARTSSASEDLNTRLVQANMSWNPRQGTLRDALPERAARRGQGRALPRGAIYDVIIDLREGSPTYKEWIGVELSADNGRALYVPEGVRPRLPDARARLRGALPRDRVLHAREGGVRWNDPAFGIEWPNVAGRSCPRRTRPGRTSRSADDHRRQRARGARGRGQSDPGRDDRLRLHGPRALPQILNRRRRMRLVAIANRTLQRARDAYAPRRRMSSRSTMRASLTSWRSTRTPGRTRSTCARSSRRHPQVDVLLDVTGAVEQGARVVSTAIEHGKHVVLMNPELDGTVGPLLQAQGRRGGRRLHRTPTATSPASAEPLPLRQGPRRAPGAVRQHQGPARSVPQPDDAGGLRRALGAEPVHGHVLRRRDEGLVRAGVVANATGMTVASAACTADCRAGTHDRRSAEALRPGRAPRRARHRRLRGRREPGPGRLRARHARRPAPAPLPQPLQARRGAALLLLHALPPLPLRGADHGRPGRPVRDAAIAPIGPPLLEVVATAKGDLEAGEDDRRARRLLTYGEAENAEVAAAERSCRSGSRRAAGSGATSPRTTVLTYADVEVPAGRLVDACAPSRTLRAAAC